MTAYGRVALARADVVVAALDGEFGAQVAAEAARLSERHQIVTVAVDGLEAALRACPARLSTMGRGLDEDLAYFLTAAAAASMPAACCVDSGAQPCLRASMMSTTNTRVSVPVMPAVDFPAEP